MNNFNGLTIKRLLQKLEGIPEDTPVYYQRIQDIYFDECGWGNASRTIEWDGIHEYIPAWDATYHDKENCFIIDAHY